MIFGELPSWLDVERSSVRSDCILAGACSALGWQRALAVLLALVSTPRSQAT
jgi:hypothetical protein